MKSRAYGLEGHRAALGLAASLVVTLEEENTKVKGKRGETQKHPLSPQAVKGVGRDMQGHPRPFAPVNRLREAVVTKHQKL